MVGVGDGKPREAPSTGDREARFAMWIGEGCGPLPPPEIRFGENSEGWTSDGETTRGSGEFGGVE